MSDVSLLRLCILETASLLKQGYWPETCDHDFNDGNPFSALPSDVVDELIISVIQLSPSGTLTMRDLYPLLTSSRVRNFKLEDVSLPTDQLVGILMSLSVSGQNLISVTLRNIFFSDFCGSQNDHSKCFLKNSALECLLTMSPLLESLESNIEFDLSTIQKAASLKRLKLNFVPKCPLYDMLSECEGTILPNCSLTHLYVFEDYRNPVSKVEIAYVLQYCKDLVYIDNDIAKSLEYLHNDELCDGTLDIEYKLQKCLLGSAFSNGSQASASVNAIHIATITCPQLKELDVLVCDHNAIYALSDFKNLTSLLIQWDPINLGDFRLGLQLLVEKIGSKLKSLFIMNFDYVDFYAIAKFCPLLEALKVEYGCESHSCEAPEKSFENLKSLHLECTDGIGASSETIVLLLSNCQELTCLHIQGMALLTDDAMRKVFENNILSQLKEAAILDCGIQAESLRKIALNCPNLDMLHINSSALSFEDIADIVHAINPLVIIRSDAWP